MRDNSRDREIIRHILRYCDQIETAHADFGRSRERFDRSATYQNAYRCVFFKSVNWSTA